ncbi:hypothetical protein BST91_07375 [Nonlabens tegetincola]|uniref:DUF6686 family protein n=1 Tax=Nonlabens tegetincola TaxID=323273 RepID=UPI000A201C82|nr:DUF6686 family protein [Nonlabens tegetincola]ARN71469.1 hypothetical protein BST91_07375 [Nonlabens tegetincola]
MNHELQLITKNQFGELNYCNGCDCYSLVFSNFIFKFTVNEFETFQNYINDIPMSFWNNSEMMKNKKRRIPIHTKQKNLTLVFNGEEFTKLKALVNGVTKKDEFLSLLDIDYPLHLN